MDKEVTNCIRKDIATTVEQLKDAVDRRSKDASPAAVTSMDPAQLHAERYTNHSIG